MQAASITLALFLSSGCGGGSGGGTLTPPIVPPPGQIAISISGIAVDEGNFDPAPTVDAGGMVWMSYSHVSIAPSGINLIETRLATTADGGLNWQDAGVLVNTATSLVLPAPNDVNAIAHEVSRLVYNPFAVATGADPWLMLWHRYLSVLNGGATIRLFQHGWMEMKSGATATTLGNERKLFTGFGYDTINNSDPLGAPEYPLDTLEPSALGDCLVYSEPGVLPKSSGVYVSMLCAKVTPPGKIILLRCDHDMGNCTYLGDLIDGSEANTVNAAYDGFSASELVRVAGQDYLIVTPTLSAGNLYRGCVAYRITDLDNSLIERNAGVAVAALVIPENGDFNGACGYVAELSGSGILISEAFITETPTFRIFATEEQL